MVRRRNIANKNAPFYASIYKKTIRIFVTPAAPNMPSTFIVKALFAVPNVRIFFSKFRHHSGSFCQFVLQGLRIRFSESNFYRNSTAQFTFGGATWPFFFYVAIRAHCVGGAEQPKTITYRKMSSLSVCTKASHLRLTGWPRAGRQ